MKQTPRWVLVAAGTAPVALIGGWTLAGLRQPPSYSPIRDTISALAGGGATDRWIMTSALVGLGASYIFTAAGLSPARTTGRLMLAIGGAATLGVATFPQPAVGNSVAHTISATVALVAVGAWPAFAARRQSRGTALTPAISAGAVVIMLGTVAWFAAELHGGQRGLAERIATGIESIWPLVVVLTTLTIDSHSKLNSRHQVLDNS